MKKRILCEECAKRFKDGGLQADWIRPPKHYGDKQKCEECRKKRYCGECVVGK